MANLFELAKLQVEREGLLNAPDVELLILDRAEKIRKHLDKLEDKKAKSRFKKLS